MPTVLITPEAILHQDAPHVDALLAAGFQITYPDDPTFTRGLTSESETVRQLTDCHAIIAGGENLTSGVLAQLPQLRVIARCGVGYDRVDVAAATKHKIALTITPTANHQCVAEHALMLMLGVAKSVIANDRATRAGEWPMKLTAPLRTKTCGILGLGRIGRSLATRVRAMGMRVIATENYPDRDFVSQNEIELVEFERLLAESDYLSIHCPLNEQTEGLFGWDVLRKMKKGSYLINTARGKLVVEADLNRALREGHLAGAGLDVYEQEPPSPDNPLFELENVVLAPHLGGADRLSQRDMAIECADCIIRLYRGEWPEGAVVNDSLRENWSWAT